MIFKFYANSNFDNLFLGQTMQKVAGRMGIQIANPKVVSIPDDRTDSYVKQLRNLVDPSVQMVMTLVPQQKSDRYGKDRFSIFFSFFRDNLLQ